MATTVTIDSDGRHATRRPLYRVKLHWDGSPWVCRDVELSAAEAAILLEDREAFVSLLRQLLPDPPDQVEAEIYRD